MAEITAQMVKELRAVTDAGMMDCKKALVACNGNMDEAVKFLRERGIAKAAEKAGREAHEGTVATVVEGRNGIIFELNCETDFCAKGDKFRTLTDRIGKVLIASSATTAAEALAVPTEDTTVENFIAEQCAAIGENMKLRRFARLTVNGEGSLTSYIHMGGKVGVLLQVTCEKRETTTDATYTALCKDLTLHIAACAPASVDASSLDPAFVAEEQEIAKAQLIAEGKPPALLEKILPGKLRALYKRSCLLNQEFVKDTAVTVEKLLQKTSEQLGDRIEVAAFRCFRLGA